MVWTSASNSDCAIAAAVVAALRQWPNAAAGVLPPRDVVAAAFATAPERVVAAGVLQWITTARAAGYGFVKPWFPDAADFAKSALWERIRSGREPLPEPPPRGLSCPWYALIEGPGPHYVPDAEPLPTTHPLLQRADGTQDARTLWVVLQNVYEVVAQHGPRELLLADAGHAPTRWRFRLWFDPEYEVRGWSLPGQPLRRGGWLLQYVAFTTDTPA